MRADMLDSADLRKSVIHENSYHGRQSSYFVGYVLKL